jgi:hypothetical protein
MKYTSEEIVALLKSAESGDQSLVDTRKATLEARRFFTSFFTAKSSYDVAGTMRHFSPQLMTYTDAALGVAKDSAEELREMLATVMPGWAPGVSYPTRILGNTSSAVVAFTDTPGVFGAEIRVLSAIDFKDGKVVRWIDYWDGLSVDAGLYEKARQPEPQFAKNLKTASLANSATTSITRVARDLQTAFARCDAKAAADLFTYDAVYEDMPLRTQILGQAAIERYMQRTLALVPYGEGSTLSHALGSDHGGGFEWVPAAAKRVKFGITALELDGEGKISRLTTTYDSRPLGMKARDLLVSLSADPSTISSLSADLPMASARTTRPAIPTRSGDRPRTIGPAPHTQVEQVPTGSLSRQLLYLVSALPDVILGKSERAPSGTVGLHLPANAASNDRDAFLIGREFAHIHPDDHALHLVLPEPMRSAAIEAGWAERHPLAGHSTTSPGTIMVYAPRDSDELGVVARFVEAAWGNAHRRGGSR